MEVRSPNARPIRLVEARLDGRPASQITNLKTTEQAKGEAAQRLHIMVPVPAGQQVTLQVIAWSEDTASEAASVTVRGRPRLDDAQIRKPRLNVVLVGVSNYSNQDLRLKFAARDAHDLNDALMKQQGGLYREVNPELLVDQDVTREAILRKLVWLEQNTTQGDLAVIFLAGHGVVEEADDYYFLPFDADEENLVTKGISGADLLHQLRRIPGRTVLFLDTCYAGALGHGTRAIQPDISKLINEMSGPEIGVAVYSATTGRERAQELDSLHNGVFTRAILDALDGVAGQPTDGALRYSVLETKLADEVEKMTGGKQHATYNPLVSLSDAPLFLIRP